MATVPEAVPNPENQGESITPWVAAPGDSHVAQFRLLDRSLSEFGASSEVWVTFKGGGKNHTPAKTYRYKIGSHDKAKEVFAALCGAAHPGEVVDRELKKPRVPYEGPFYV